MKFENVLILSENRNVKKIFILVSVIFIANSVFAKESLRTLDSIEFENGEIEKMGLIADVDGIVFLEFNENVVSVVSDSKTKFTGEIMPPEIISLPDRAPRARMREIYTFELLADTSDEISFADKVDLLNERSRIRLSYNDPDSLVRTSAVKLLSPIKEEFGILALWKYLPEKEEWKRLGGTTDNTSFEDTFVFSAVIWGTGIYSLFDENPSPTFSPTFPIDEIEMVEDSPFPSVDGGDDILNDYVEENIVPEVDSNLFDEDSVYTTDDEYEVPALVPLASAEGDRVALDSIPDPALSAEVPALGTETLATSADKPQEFTLPKNTDLPKSGPESNQEKSSKTPIIILLTMAIVGTSIYFAARKQA